MKIRQSFLRSAFVFAAAVVPGLATAQAAKNPPPKMMMGEDHAMMSGWKELDAFHTVLAATWHPAAKNDLTAIRAKAPALADAAKKWAASRTPSACDTKPVRDAIAAVVTGSDQVARLVVKQAADSLVKSALSDVHTRFEVAEKACQPEHAHKP